MADGIMVSIIIWCSLFFVAFIMLCACALASEFDEIAEQDWKDFMEENKEDGLLQEMYEQE